MLVKQRVCVYIDGFNLYYGVTTLWKDIKWLNPISLSQSLIKNNQQLKNVKYYTARITSNREKQRRQQIYLEALTEVGVEIIPGKFLRTTIVCRNCRDKRKKYNEKMTDVNIATDLIIDAHLNRYDKALLISGDSDLVPPIKAINKHFIDKKVVVIFPPNRNNASLKQVAFDSFALGRKKLKDHQLPPSITKDDGYVLHKPEEWQKKLKT